MASMASSFSTMASNFKSYQLGIVVHSYANRWKPKTESVKYPGFQSAIDLLEHCASIGASGIQVTLEGWTEDFSKKVRDRREKLNMYLEGSISLPKDDTGAAIFEDQLLRAREAGATVLRSVCLNGRRYENFKTAAEFEAFKTQSIAAIQRAEPIVRKHKMKLAIENHKDWRSPELAALMKQMGSEWLGVTLDFGNNISLLEDPNDVVKNLLPYLISTHVKDMAMATHPDGFLMSEVPLGNGIIDLPKIFGQCMQQNPNATLNLEMITRDPLKIPCLTDEYWATFQDVSGMELARTLRLVGKSSPTDGLPAISKLENDAKLEVEERNIVKSIEYVQKM
jgi:sugar phosphate isomerase/epimerase